jgi:hypothetical protein
MTANAGTIVAVGSSGRTYTVDAYVPDATSTFLALNPSGLASSTSPSTFRAPENLVIKDIAIGAVPSAVGCILQLNNANANGGTFRWAQQLAANPNRPKYNLPVRAGDFISFLQF